MAGRHGVMIFTWRMAALPAYVVIINQSGSALANEGLPNLGPAVMLSRSGDSSLFLR
jgi:hypothetical protein